MASIAAKVVSMSTNNPFLKSIDFVSEIVPDGNIDFVVKFLKILKDKPEPTKDTFTKEMKDPFLPPFEDGSWIAELSETHDLIFNKYNIAKSHVIVITKRFEAQTDRFND